MTLPAAIVGAAQAPYRRASGAGTTTETLLVDAAMEAIADAGLERDAVDGLGVASFTLQPDHAIDLAWRLGLRLRWMMQDSSGGVAGVNMLQHAVHALEAGEASAIVLVGGDRMLNREFFDVVDHYNKATRDHLAPIPFDGPNTLFSAVTQRHMRAHGLEREDYGLVAIAQRRWAALNPGAVYRAPLTMEEYLSAPLVAAPLGRYDCPPIVHGADAIVLAAPERASGATASVRAIGALHNRDQQEGDGLKTGLSEVAAELWGAASLAPGEVDFAWLYDDYPVMVLIQAADLGLIEDGDVQGFIHRRLAEEHWPLNTSGGQLSAGQAGGGAAIHGLVEGARQLRGVAGERQVPAARTAVVSGYGGVLYRYGACANAAVLERVP